MVIWYDSITQKFNAVLSPQIENPVGCFGDMQVDPITGLFVKCMILEIGSAAGLGARFFRDPDNAMSSMSTVGNLVNLQTLNETKPLFSAAYVAIIKEWARLNNVRYM